MKKETFAKIRLLIAIALGAIFAASITAGNYIAPVLAMITALAIIIVTKKRVKDVMADERDFKIAGVAARMTFSVFAIAAAVLGAVLIAMGKTNPALLPIGFTLAYSAMALMLLNIAFFYYYRNKV